MSEAGKVYLFSMQFYDVKSGMMAFKARPALIIYGPRNNDYTVLPVSTIKNPKDRDPDYDLRIDPRDYPNLSFNDVCYIRTHKQTPVHRSSKYKLIGDLKKEYPQKYQEVVALMEKFEQEIKQKA